MFNESKYTKWYFRIIDSARYRVVEGYSERHHILPKSIGGSDDNSNLVSLTAREHLVCHLLLTKMTSGEYRAKMIHAASMMVGKHATKFNSRLYQRLREEFGQTRSRSYSGENNPFYGKKHTEETRLKISGENNPAKRPEVQLRMRKPKTKKRIFVPCSPEKKEALRQKAKEQWAKQKALGIEGRSVKIE